MKLAKAFLLVFLVGCFLSAFIPVVNAQWKRAAGWTIDLHSSVDGQVRGFLAFGNKLLADVPCAITSNQGTPDSLFVSTDNGQSWSAFSGNGSIPLMVFGNYLLGVADSFTGINVLSWQAYTTNNGATWIPDTIGFPPSVTTATALISVGNTIYAATPGGGVYKHSTPGTPWVPDTVGLTSNGQYQLGMTSLALSGTTILAGLTPGYGVASQQDGGPWNLSNAGMPSSTATAQLISSGSSVFALTADLSNLGFWNVYHSNNGGQNWTLMNSTPINGGADFGMAWMAVTGQNVFVSTDSGVFVSKNNGTTFTLSNTGLPPYDLNGFYTTAIQISGSNVVIGTGDSGIYYRSLSDFGISAVSPTTSESSTFSLSLSQDPAQGMTNVTYSLPEAGPATLELMDELGRSVRMLYRGPATSGENQIALDAQSLVPGTYFVRVEANGASAMQKLVIE